MFTQNAPSMLRNFPRQKNLKGGQAGATLFNFTSFVFEQLILVKTFRYFLKHLKHLKLHIEH